MVTASIHRIIERHAATRGDAIAIMGDRQAMTYRDLNQRANLVARRLHAAGFRRGSHAVARMRRGVDLAIVLLAVLKAGGSYAWTDAPDAQVTIMPTPFDARQDVMTIDIHALLRGQACACPNLPIVTRGTDIACVLRDRRGVAATLVPHATITSLFGRQLPMSPYWGSESGALDLWLVLMAGNTMVIEGEPAKIAAA